MKKIIGILFVTMLFLTGCGSNTPDIDVDKLVLSEYITVSYEGSNGDAIALFEVDIDTVEKIAEKLGSKKEDATEYVQSLDYEVTPNTQLMNNDGISIKIVDNQKAKEALALDVEGLEFKVTVSGLEGTVAMTNDELYKDIRVIVDGDSLTVENNSQHTNHQNIKYTVEKTGDDYIVNAEVPEDIVVEGGVKPSTNSTVIDKDGKPIRKSETMLQVEKRVLAMGQTEVQGVYMNIVQDLTKYTIDMKILGVNITNEFVYETTDGNYFIISEGTITVDAGTYPLQFATVMNGTGEVVSKRIVSLSPNSGMYKTFEAFHDTMKANVSSGFGFTLK